MYGDSRVAHRRCHFLEEVVAVSFMALAFVLEIQAGPAARLL